MEEKIYQKLLEKLGKTSLSERTIRAKAARLAKKINNDEGLTDDVISDAVEDLKDIEGQLNHDISEKVSAAKKNSDTEIESLKAQISKLGGTPADDPISKKIAELEAKQADFEARIKAEDIRKKNKEILASADELLKTDKYKCSNDTIRGLVLRSYSVGENDTAESIAEKVKKDYDVQYKEIFKDGATPFSGSGQSSKEFDVKADFEMLKANGLLPKDAQLPKN